MRCIACDHCNTIPSAKQRNMITDDEGDVYCAVCWEEIWLVMDEFMEEEYGEDDYQDWPGDGVGEDDVVGPAPGDEGSSEESDY